jgi:hypothetical protein
MYYAHGVPRNVTFSFLLFIYSGGGPTIGEQTGLLSPRLLAAQDNRKAQVRGKIPWAFERARQPGGESDSRM